MLVEIVPHTVQHQIDGKRAALLDLLRKIAIPGSRIVRIPGFSPHLKFRHVLGVKFDHQGLQFLQHPIERPHRSKGVPLIAFVAQNAMQASSVRWPTENNHFNIKVFLQLFDPIKHVGHIVVVAMNKQQQVSSGFLRAGAVAGFFDQLACHIGARRVGIIGIEIDAFRHCRRDLVRQNVDMPPVSPSGCFRQPQFIGALNGLATKRFVFTVFAFIDGSIGHDIHGADSFMLPCHERTGGHY